MSGVRYLPGAAEPVALRPVRRPLLALLDVAQAEQFLTELDGRTAGADLPRAMYLLGLAQGHLETMLDLIRATTEVQP